MMNIMQLNKQFIDGVRQCDYKIGTRFLVHEPIYDFSGFLIKVGTKLSIDTLGWEYTWIRDTFGHRNYKFDHEDFNSLVRRKKLTKLGDA